MSSRIYVGRLSDRASERDIERFFKGYGRLRDIVLKNGFGFVEFENSRDADDAVYDLNGKDLCGERVVLEFSHRAPRGRGMNRFGRYQPPRRVSRYGPPQQTRYRLVVKNLSSRVSWQDLKDMMRTAGEVTYADAHREHTNEGVVCFSSHDALLRAIDKLQDKEVNGRKLKLIDDSEDKESRSRSRSRHRSRSRSMSSRSRSHSSHSRSRSRTTSPKKSRSETRSRSRSVTPRPSSANGSPQKNGGKDSPPRNGVDSEPVEHEQNRNTEPA